jgi:4-coumarate--CoA ligase
MSKGSYLAPPVLLFMNKHPMVNDYDLSSLRNIILGAAPVSTELILDTRAKLRARGAKDIEITQVRCLLSITF